MLVDFSLAVTGEETVGALELFVFDSLEDFVFFLLISSLLGDSSGLLIHSIFFFTVLMYFL